MVSLELGSQASRAGGSRASRPPEDLLQNKAAQSSSFVAVPRVDLLIAIAIPGDEDLDAVSCRKIYSRLPDPAGTLVAYRSSSFTLEKGRETAR